MKQPLNESTACESTTPTHTDRADRGDGWYIPSAKSILYLSLYKVLQYRCNIDIVAVR
jgi:hypothetical protein